MVPRQILTDIIDIQELKVLSDDRGMQKTWKTVACDIYANVVALYDNVNYQVWGNAQSHNIYRVLIDWNTAKLINVNFGKTQFIWKTYEDFERILKPNSDFQIYGVDRRFGYCNAEDSSTYEASNGKNPATTTT